MFLSLCRTAKKSKNVLVMLRSAAGTGIEVTAKRARLNDKIVRLIYDPVVKQRVLFVEHWKIRSM